MNIILLVAGVALYRNLSRDDTLMKFQIPWILIVGNFVGLLWSLIPVTFQQDNRIYSNDCLLLLEIWTPRFAETLKRTIQGGGKSLFDFLPDHISGMVLMFLGSCVALFGVFSATQTLGEAVENRSWLRPALFAAAGCLLFIVSSQLGKPRLTAAYDLSKTEWPPSVIEAYKADLSRLTDGCSRPVTDQFIQRSWHLYVQGRVQQALDVIADALEKHPRFLELLVTEAEILGEVGLEIPAGASLGAALRIPEISESTRAILISKCVDLFAALGKTEQAASFGTVAAERLGDPQARLFLLHKLASLPLLPGRVEFLLHAAKWSGEAVALEPSPATWATRGGVLFELGRFDDAESLLQIAAETGTTAADLGLAYMYLALLAKVRRNNVTARRLARVAFRHYRDRRLVERLAKDGLASL